MTTGLEVVDLTVQFGGVLSLDAVSIPFGPGNCGLIGPNGAGKTTFLNVVTGFVTPLEGRVLVDGIDLSSLATHRRSRAGVRRTFQTEQTIESLSVYDNVRVVHEHTVGRRAEERTAVMKALELTSLVDVANERVDGLGAGVRRFVEIARAIVGSPRVVLLDEPAAGLPDDETERLAAVIAGLPNVLDATVVLVDHDMSLVRACCDTTAVLDFGRLIAHGRTTDVLDDPIVRAAYLGDEPL